MQKETINYGAPLRHIMINITVGVILFFLSLIATVFLSLFFLLLILPSLFFFWNAYRWNKGSKASTRILFCQQFIKVIEPKDGDKILDVGTGGGLLAIEIAKEINSTEIYGIDIWKWFYSGTNIEIARKNAEISEVIDKVRFEYGNALSIPFTDKYFDIVIASFIIHNIKKNRVQGITEMIRVLKIGGKFAILEPTKDTFLNWEVNESLKNSLSNLGLRDVKFIPVHVSFPKERMATAIFGIKE